MDRTPLAEKQTGLRQLVWGSSLFETRTSAPEQAMTRDTIGELDITSAEEFEEALAAVIKTAVFEGVEVRGVWEFQTDGSTHNWEVEIVELATEFETEETNE